MVLEYEGYQIVQDEEDYRSIHILRDDKEVMHFNVSKLLNEGELRETVGDCLKLIGSMNTDDYVFGAETFYDGDEPC